MKIKAGATNVSVYYYIVQDASGTSPGEPVTGLLFSDIETGGSASYMRQGAARVDLTLITLASASAAHSDGGFILVDDVNMPGLYRCDYPDAAFATGVSQVFCQIVVASANNAVAAPILIDINDSIDQTGDSFARLGAPVDATISGDIAGVQTSVNNIAAAPGTGARPFVPSTITVVTGTGATGTADDLANDDASVYALNDSAGTLTLDFDYQLNPDVEVVEFLLIAAAQGVADDISVQFYDQVGLAWDTVDTLVGASVLTYRTIDKVVVNKYTDNSGLFQVRFTGTGLTTATITIDKAVAYGVSTVLSAGYDLASVWVDTVSGTSTSAAPGVDATVTNRSTLFNNAQSVAAQLGYNKISITNGNTVTLSQAINNFQIGEKGSNWTLALGGQDVSNCDINDANITGIAAGTDTHWHNCNFGNTTIVPGSFLFSASWSGTVTLLGAGDYYIFNSKSAVAGAGSPVLDFASVVGSTSVNIRGHKGGITINGLTSDHVITVGGEELGTITLNGADAAVEIRGVYKSLVNNLTGTPTVDTDGAIKGVDVFSILTDTGTTLPASIADVVTDTGTTLPAQIAALNNLSAAQVNAEVVDVMVTDTFAEVSVPAATASLKDMIHYIFSKARNKITQTSTTFTLRDDTDSNNLSTATVSDDGTTTTKGKDS